MQRCERVYPALLTLALGCRAVDPATPVEEPANARVEPPVFAEQPSSDEPPRTPASDPILTIPEGAFAYGTDAAELPELMQLCQRDESTCVPEWFADESPVVMHTLPSFRIDRTEVSNAAYAECFAAGDCPVHRPTDCLDIGPAGKPVDEQRLAEFGDPAQPVVCINAYEAMGYCAFAGGRLPSAAEWEKAARGPDGRPYPWGPSPPTCDEANFRTQALGRGCGHDTTGPVDAHAASPSYYGALNMAGNVAEWVTPNYVTGTETDFQVRGGHWNAFAVFLRPADRRLLAPEVRSLEVGFRCAYDR